MTLVSFRRVAVRVIVTCVLGSCSMSLDALRVDELKNNGEALRSPWDLHRIALRQTGYSCPQLSSLPHDIVANSYYSDSQGSIKDPIRYEAYEAAVKPFLATEDAAEAAADEYQTRGSRQAAACAAQVLVREAQADAMTGSMSSNQANYVQRWALGALAVVWLKVRPAGEIALNITPAQEDEIKDWMKRAALQVQDHFRRANNNHLYWAGYAVMSVGIAVNDRALFEWGAGTYKFGVDQIGSDGTLQQEMRRGKRALHYHLFALTPLVIMAEFAQVNEDDLYAYDNSRIRLLVACTTAGLIDNRHFAELAGAAQDTPDDGPIDGSDIDWIGLCARRFPDPAITALLKRYPAQPDRYVGGLPPR